MGSHSLFHGIFPSQGLNPDPLRKELGLLVTGLPGKTPALLSFVSTCSVVQSCPTLCETLWIIACQAPLSMGFSRQEYWSRLPCPPPGDLPKLGIKPRSSALQVDSLLSEPGPGKQGNRFSPRVSKTDVALLTHFRFLTPSAIRE